VVAHGLLVERRRSAARLPRVGGPEAGRVGGQHLVAQHEVAVDEAELELGVGDDDAALAAPLGAPPVELQRHVADLGRQGLAHQVGGRRERDVLVVTLVRLGRRGEHRLGQPVGLPQAVGQRGAVHGAGPAVLLPGRAGDVAPDDALHRQHLGAADQHDPAGQVGLVGHRAGVGRQVGDVGRLQVPGHHVGQLGEPERRHGGEHPALVGDRLAHHDVEGRDAVARHHQQAVVVHRVDVADLARVDVRQAEVGHCLLDLAALGHGSPPGGGEGHKIGSGR
jgi:hypothetical protein